MTASSTCPPRSSEKNLLKFRIARCFAFGICGLNHTIRVQEQPVTWAHFEVANGIVHSRRTLR